MSSPDKPPDDFLDLERGLPVTPEDVLAQRKAREGPAMTFAEYLAWLSSLPSPTYEELKARGVTRGEPFRLDD